MLKQATLFAVIVAVCQTVASAQSQSSGDDYHRTNFTSGIPTTRSTRETAPDCTVPNFLTLAISRDISV